jgi:putative tricarboxylic transport membrane protein
MFQVKIYNEEENVQMSKKIMTVCLFLFLLISLAACGGDQTASESEETTTEKQETSLDEGTTKTMEESSFEYPKETLDWTIAFGPGGGNDRMARTFIDILKKYDYYEENIVSNNRQGGSGAVGWGYLFNQKGNPYHISTTSGSFITTPLKSDVGFNYESFTPVALMATDDLLIVVKGDSPYNSVDDLIEAAQTEMISIGGSGTANVDFIITSRLEEATGADFEYVPFQSAGERATALLSDSTNATIAFAGEVIGLVKSGEIKALAFTGKTRIPSLKDVPTMDELGYDVSVPMPRGVVLPGDVPKEAQDWWIETMKKVAETPEWKDFIEKNHLTEYILYGDEFKEYLKDTSKKFEKALKEAGAIQ